MNVIEEFSVEGDHIAVGRAIGRRFGDKIHAFFDHYGFLRERVMAFHRTAAGRELYDRFLALHQDRFPAYIAELQGMAEGAEHPFEELFLVNLRGEYGGLMPRKPEGDGAGCTDCLANTADAALIGHNEDGSAAGLGNMYVLRVQLKDQAPFSALCYPGFLPGNAFGFNGAGVMHSIDSVSPRPIQVGFSRHFLARSVLDATSLQDAIERVSLPGRASGFTYNMGSLTERRVVSVEVSPDRHHVHEVTGWYIHTNHYRQLGGIEQEIGLSSEARLARGEALCRETPPQRPGHVLAVLGDEAREDYPIYRHGDPPDGGVTLCTGLFDLDAGALRIYAGHPIQEPDAYLALELAA
jgi:hypothetical protein